MLNYNVLEEMTLRKKPNVGKECRIELAPQFTQKGYRLRTSYI